MADGTMFGQLRHKDGRRPLRAVDLFCGAGGTSLGVEMGLGVSPVAAVNHWPYAIQTHAQNHPTTLHFLEDVFNVAPWEAARGMELDLLVGSPSCVHFSTAKGGQPLDAGLRALADVFVKWAKELRPRVMIVENVREFRDWGPLDEKGRPIKARKGEDYRAWIRAIEAEGYVYECRLLRACDYGAPTSRLRYFGVFRRDGQPIRWPTPTHGPGTAQPWHAAAEVIDWSIPCRSIFGRKKPLAEATMARIAAGVRKFVVESASPFLLTNTTGHAPTPLSAPTPTLTTGNQQYLVAPSIVPVGYGERKGLAPRCAPISAPLGTVVGAGKHALIAAYIARHFTGAVGRELQSPLPTVTTVDHHSLVAAFLTKYYGTGNGQPVSAPLDTVTTRDRFALTTVNISGEPWQIVDIGMRMLQPRELARAQGFPDSYIFNGSKTDQIAAIGNSVVPQVMAALTRANLGTP